MSGTAAATDSTTEDFTAACGARAIAPPLYAFTAAVGGIANGFVVVTLGYVLAGRGFSAATIAGFVGLVLLPSTWRVLIGPVVDLSLTARSWFLLSAAGAAIGLALFAAVRLDPDNAWQIGTIALVLGIFYAVCDSARTAAIAITSSPRVRGRIAGWVQAGSLGGTGVGGGVGLWLASHFSMPVAAGTLALLCLACAWPMLLIRTPRAVADLPIAATVRRIGGDALTLVVTRRGLLTVAAVTLPMGQGAFINLLPSIARDWGASADLTATVTGVLAGLIVIPGCVLGGYLCDRMSAQAVLAWSSIVCAGGELAMALGPRTPVAFVAFTLANNLLMGVAYAAVAAAVYVGLRGASGGTVGSTLGSLSNVPLVGVTALLAVMAAPYGSSGMLISEAVVGFVSALAYLGLAWLWRPRPGPLPALA